jgi:hypothetical protein
MDFFDRVSGLVLDLTAIDLPVIDENIPHISARLPLSGLCTDRAKPQAFEPFELPPAVGRKKFQRVIERAHRGVSRDLHVDYVTKPIQIRCQNITNGVEAIGSSPPSTLFGKGAGVERQAKKRPRSPGAA